MYTPSSLVLLPKSVCVARTGKALESTTEKRKRRSAQVAPGPFRRSPLQTNTQTHTQERKQHDTLQKEFSSLSNPTWTRAQKRSVTWEGGGEWGGVCMSAEGSKRNEKGTNTEHRTREERRRASDKWGHPCRRARRATPANAEKEKDRRRSDSKFNERAKKKEASSKDRGCHTAAPSRASFLPLYTKQLKRASLSLALDSAAGGGGGGALWSEGYQTPPPEGGVPRIQNSKINRDRQTRKAEATKSSRKRRKRRV